MYFAKLFGHIGLQDNNLMYDVKCKIFGIGGLKISMRCYLWLLPIAVCYLLALASCKKDNSKPQWDTQILAPFLKSSLSIKDLLTDTLLKANADNSLKIVYSNHLYQFSTDTLLHISDTTVTKELGQNNFYKFGLIV